MNGNPDQYLPAAKASRGRSRLFVAAIVVVHLLLALAAQAVLSLGHSSKSWPDIYAQLIIAGLFGLHIGQICLVASWAAFSGQTWFPRTLRFLSLAAWLFLVDALGAYLVEGDIAKSLIEELAAYELLLILPPLLILVAFGILSGRRFLNRATHHPSSHQFSTKHLLLITADIAAMLALGRIVLSWKPDHFWDGLTGMRPEELIPVAASLTVLPAVFYGLARNRTWTRFLILTVYFVLSSFSVAGVQIR